MRDRTAVGAEATVYYKDDPENPLGGVYFSFGEYIEEKGVDSFGVNDLRIFFYVEGEQDMKSLMDPNGVEDFVVVEYTITHSTEQETSDMEQYDILADIVDVKHGINGLKTKIIRWLINRLPHQDDYAFSIVEMCRTHFNVTAEVYGRTDVEAYAGRKITDEEWAVVRGTEAWRELSDTSDNYALVVDAWEEATDPYDRPLWSISINH